MDYISYGITLSPYQKEKIAIAVRKNKGVRVRLTVSDLTGTDKILLTKEQITKINLAKKNDVGVLLHFSKTQLSKQGGFLGALLGGLAASLLPSLLGIKGSGVFLPGTHPKTGKGKKKL